VAVNYEHRANIVRHWLQLLGTDIPACLAAMDLVPDIAKLDDTERETVTSAYRQALKALLQEPATDVRIRALTGISRWPAGYRINIDELLDHPLDSEDPAQRTAAADCLHLVIADDRDTRIARTLGDGHPRVREAALRSLQRVTDDFVQTAILWITDNQCNPRAQGALLGALQEMGLPSARYEAIAMRKIDEARNLQAAVAVLEEASAGVGDLPALELVRYTLSERMNQMLHLALQALEPLHEPGLISIIRAGFSSGDSRHVANAIEVLANLDDHKVAGQLHDILQLSISKQTGKPAKADLSALQEVLDWCLQQKDDWLRHCASTVLSTLSPGNSRA
jgi:hypothetical protein